MARVCGCAGVRNRCAGVSSVCLCTCGWQLLGTAQTCGCWWRIAIRGHDVLDEMWRVVVRVMCSALHVTSTVTLSVCGGLGLLALPLLTTLRLTGHSVSWVLPFLCLWLALFGLMDLSVHSLALRKLRSGLWSPSRAGAFSSYRWLWYWPRRVLVRVRVHVRVCMCVCVCVCMCTCHVPHGVCAACPPFFLVPTAAPSRVHVLLGAQTWRPSWATSSRPSCWPLSSFGARTCSHSPCTTTDLLAVVGARRAPPPTPTRSLGRGRDPPSYCALGPLCGFACGRCGSPRRHPRLDPLPLLRARCAHRLPAGNPDSSHPVSRVGPLPPSPLVARFSGRNTA
jgi:hypothetical protein